jgi:hypothetical protein
LASDALHSNKPGRVWFRHQGKQPYVNVIPALGHGRPGARCLPKAQFYPQDERQFRAFSSTEPNNRNGIPAIRREEIA